MFRPHIGICVCHGEKRLIVIKKGLCKIGNDERKGINKKRTSPAVGISQGKCFGGRSNRSPIKKDVLKSSKKTILDESKNKETIKKRSPIKYIRRDTGEKEVFIEIFEESLKENEQEGLSCRCCGGWLGFEPFVWMFSHLLAKSTFNAFRLWKRNIWICCFSCHGNWDQGSRSGDIFREKRRVAASLKQFYYWLTHNNKLTNIPKELEKQFKIFQDEQQ